MSSFFFFFNLPLCTQAAVKMACPHCHPLWGSEILLFGWVAPCLCQGAPSSWTTPGKHPDSMSYSTWHCEGSTAEVPGSSWYRCPLPLSWLNLLNPLTSCELEEKPSSLRLVLSLVVGLSAEATGPISLCAPLCVSFCFLASFLWDMCKGNKITVRWWQLHPSTGRSDCSFSPSIILNPQTWSIFQKQSQGRSSKVKVE